MSIKRSRLLMSKFNNLWIWISKNGEERFKLTFKQIEDIAGIPIDHSFLTYKKELPEYGYKVGKISLKEQTVSFEKIYPPLTRPLGQALYF